MSGEGNLVLRCKQCGDVHEAKLLRATHFTNDALELHVEVECPVCKDVREVNPPDPRLLQKSSA